MIKEYAVENNLVKIAELLADKGSEVLDRYMADEITNVTNENIDFPVPVEETCDMKIIEIFSKKNNFKKNTKYLCRGN